ncbi:MAG: glycosyltransferase family 39 protein, partial [Verrucomicrobiae bacterium]|nr:glycosyltransferase family 39 protein [Verrucomicrobiae bacterium]
MGFSSKIREGWRRFRCLPQFRYFIVSALVVTVAIVILRKMEHPWEGLTAKRIRQDRPWIGEDYGRYWGFWLGLGATILVSLVTFASHWWWSWAHPQLAPNTSGNAKAKRFHRGAWFALAAILVLAAWIRVPNLNRPILRDEQDTLRYHIHGYHHYDEKHGGVFTFQDVPWSDAAFWNKVGNNPVLLSVLAKGSNDLWLKFSGKSPDHFNRIAIRLPVVIAGILSIAAIAWFVFAFASQRVALLAALLAAIHPFHIEYSEEARGYAFVMLGAALALGGAIRALRKSGWWHWIALVGGSAMMLYAYIGSVFFVAPLALTVIGIVLWRNAQTWRTADDKNARLAARRDLTRLMVTGLIGVSIYLVFALPPMICFWDHKENFPWRFTVSFQWWFVFWTEFATGQFYQLPKKPDGDFAPLSEAIAVIVKPRPWTWIGIFAASLLILVGVGKTMRRVNVATGFVIGVAFLAPFIQIFFHGVITHMVLFFFYLIYWLPVVIGLEAVGA